MFRSEALEDGIIKTLRAVLEDESFKIKTPATIKAREAVQKFLEWCLRNPDIDLFHKQLTESL